MPEGSFKDRVPFKASFKDRGPFKGSSLGIPRRVP